MSTQQTDALQCAADLEYSIARHRIQDAFILNAYKALKMVRTQHARITELESQLAQRFDAADVATASAQGFRDGVASVANQPSKDTNTAIGAEDLASRLRTACTSVRRKSYPLADLIPLMQQAADALASTPSRAAEPSITLDFKMATDLLGMFCGEPGLVTLQRGDEHCHSGPGLYAWYSDMPEEGAGFLGAEPDDEATPSAPSAPAQPVAEPAGATEMENLQRTAVGWQERALRAERNWMVCRRWAIAGGAPVEKLGDDPDQPFHAASPAIEGESNV